MTDGSGITVIYAKTGKTATVNEARARRDIAFGTAIKTEPRDPEKAKEWHAAQMEKARKALSERYDGNIGRKPDLLREHLDTLNEFASWCAENGYYALPATESLAVRYLLSRVAEGRIEQPHVSRQAFLIGKLHEATKHPPRNLGEKVFNAYNRAIVFALRRQRVDRVSVQEHQAKAPSVALEMFPDGVVPRNWHEIAA